MPGPSPRYYATDAQIRYLRRLLAEAFVHRYAHRLGIARPSATLPRAEVSAAIDALKAAKARGWVPAPPAAAEPPPAGGCTTSVVEVGGSCRVRASVEGRTFEHVKPFEPDRAAKLATLVRGRSLDALRSSELWTEVA